MIFGGDKTTLRTGVSGGRDSVDMSYFARGAREKFLGFYSLAWDTYGPPRFAWMGFQDCSFGARHTGRASGCHQRVMLPLRHVRS